jgi:hypothetical protein
MQKLTEVLPRQSKKAKDWRRRQTVGRSRKRIAKLEDRWAAMAKIVKGKDKDEARWARHDGPTLPALKLTGRYDQMVGWLPTYSHPLPFPHDHNRLK